MMKTLFLRVVFLPLFMLLSAAASADESTFSLGGDEYVSGDTASVSAAVSRDAFVAGFNALISAPVSGDAHAAGFNVSVDAPVSQDVYAAGFSVSINNTIGADLTAAGKSVTVTSPADVSGNARLSGADVTLSAPVRGALLVTAGDATLNSVVSGDFQFFGNTLSFGEGARVDGELMIRASSTVEVPESVAPADRVTFEQIEMRDAPVTPEEMAKYVGWGAWVGLWTAIFSLLFLFVVGALLIALLPNNLTTAYGVATNTPFKSILSGAVAMAALIGLVPVAAMTLLGLPLVPVVLVFVGIAWALGYVSGVLFTAWRLLQAFTPVEGNAKRLLALLVGLIVIPLLGLIPVVGWLINLAVLFLGLGAFALLLVGRWTGGTPEPRLEGAV